MRNRLAWLVGGLGLAAAAYRTATRRRQPATAPEATIDHAAELREKLAESRAVVEEREEFEAAETPVDEVAEAPSEVETRRRRVHERGREAAERMRGEGSES